MADGSIIIDTKIDTGGVMKGVDVVKAGMNRLSSQITKMGNEAKSSFQRQIMGITDLYQAYEKQERKVSELKAKLEELSKARIETEEFKKLGTEIKELEDNFVKVEAKQKEWLDMGFPIDSAPLKELDKQMDVIWADIEKLQQKQKEMKISGAAYMDPTSTEEYKRTAAIYSSESQKLERVNGRLYSSYNNLKNKVEEYWQKNNRLTQVMEKLQRAASRVGAVVKNMGSALRRAGSTIKSMVSAMKKAVENMLNLNKQTYRSRMSLSRMLGMSLLFSGVFRAISVVGDGVRTGFQNLVQYSNGTNLAISSLMSALTKLKNSFATAFAPILTTVAPILTSFINLISEAVTRVGMLVAALTGKDTFTKAIGVQENYAASLDKSASSANKAKKATKGYLSSLDEISRYDDGKSDSEAGSGGGGYTAPSASEMFETVPIESSIKDIADKIKGYIQSQDWEGLGSYMADGINTGLERVYEVISWDNVGPKIEPFISGFTTTFNSLVDNINWELMGQTVGTGINTIVKALRLAITGTDWYNLGKKFAKGIKGIVKTVNWKELGQLIGDKFMISWRIFSGFVKNLPYASIGNAVATALNGVFSTISFSEIGNSLATAMNGAFTALYNFATTFDWTQMVNNIAGGINEFVSTFDWKGNGEKLEVFLDNLCDAIVDFTETTDWEAVGKGIGTFLSQIDWWGHLWQVVHAIKDAIGRLFDGLETSGTAGKIVAFLGKAFLAIKVAQILGIDDLVVAIVGYIGRKLIGSQAALSGDLTTLIGNAASGAAGSFSEFATSLAPLVGTAGLIVGVGAAATIATSELAGLVETMQGGNGVGTTFGNTMNNFIQTLQRRGAILSGSAEEIWQLKESLEQEGMTAEDKASDTQKLIDKLGEMGVTSDQAEQAFSTLYQQGLITDDMFGILSESIKTLGDNTTNMAGSIDLGKQSIDDLYNNVLPQLQTQLGLSADQVTYLDTALLETENAGGTAQDAFNNIMERAEEMGLNTESVAKVFSQVFPDAVKETESTTKTAMENTQDSVETGMDAASVAVGTAMSGIQTDTENAMSAAERAVSDSTSNISKDSDTNWGASEGYATDALSEIDQEAYDTMQRVDGVVKRWNKDIEGDFDTNWGDSKDTVIGAIQGMADEIERNGDKLASGVESAFSGILDYITRIMNNAVGRVNSAISNINGAIESIERSFRFTYDYTNPFTNKKSTYRSWISLNRANKVPYLPGRTVPYLASGAVIPPRSEFLAVLGDQKNGRNLEAPEELLRQIVREETGGNQGSGGNYRFTAQLNRRTIFDEMIDEAKLRRDASGNNPFELS